MNKLVEYCQKDTPHGFYMVSVVSVKLITFLFFNDHHWHWFTIKQIFKSWTKKNAFLCRNIGGILHDGWFSGWFLCFNLSVCKFLLYWNGKWKEDTPQSA